ncbi:hypothetical protein GCM10007908_03220 [Rhizobium albus]|nr:hypothetical protein GCM10007908_03220 [Rhizobium albus]
MSDEVNQVLHVYDGDGGVIIRENGNISTFGKQSVAVDQAFAALSGTREAVEPVGVFVAPQNPFQHLEDALYAEGDDTAPPSDPVGQGAVTDEAWERLLNQAAHVDLGLSIRNMDVKGATLELIRMISEYRPVLSPAPEAGSDEVERLREALIRISDKDWAWQGGGSDRRHRGYAGTIAAAALGIPKELPLGWPDPTKSETRRALSDAAEGGQ